MTLSHHKISKIRELRDKSYPVREIAKKLKVSTDSVIKYSSHTYPSLKTKKQIVQQSQPYQQKYPHQLREDKTNYNNPQNQNYQQLENPPPCFSRPCYRQPRYYEYPEKIPEPKFPYKEVKKILEEQAEQNKTKRYALIEKRIDTIKKWQDEEGERKKREFEVIRRKISIEQEKEQKKLEKKLSKGQKGEFPTRLEPINIDTIDNIQKEPKIKNNKQIHNIESPKIESDNTDIISCLAPIGVAAAPFIGTLIGTIAGMEIKKRIRLDKPYQKSGKIYTIKTKKRTFRLREI